MKWWWCFSLAWIAIATGLTCIWAAYPSSDTCRLSLNNTGPHPRTSWTLCIPVMAMTIAWCTARALVFAMDRTTTRHVQASAKDGADGNQRPPCFYPRGKKQAVLNLCDWLYFFSVSCSLSTHGRAADFLIFAAFWSWAFLVAATVDELGHSAGGGGAYLSFVRIVVLLSTVFASYSTTTNATRSHEIWATSSAALSATGALGVTVLMLYAVAPLIEDPDEDTAQRIKEAKQTPRRSLVADVIGECLSCACITTTRNRLAIALFIARELLCILLVTSNTMVGVTRHEESPGFQ